MTSSAAATKAQAQRLPAPSLFIGPPSRNASSHSLLLQPSHPGQSSNRAPLLRQQTARLDRTRRNAEANTESKTAEAPSSPTQPRHQGGHRENDRNDALWAEMQNTLEEVELSAINGTHVFSPTHAKALEELRTAQIALAQAWARTEADEQSSEAVDGKGEPAKMTGASLLAADRKDKLGHKGNGDDQKPRPRSGTNKTQRSKLEEETENDILLARRRREANDRYFQRVNGGVLDVVAKLEDVAKAMRGVEMESKEIWGEKDSIDTGSED